MTYPADIYTKHYFTEKGGPEQDGFDHGQLRWGDQVPAIAYALGAKSFDEVRTYFGFKDYGHAVEPRMPFFTQITSLSVAWHRIPGFVVEIGGGRGEVALALAEITRVCLIEPAPNAEELLQLARDRFASFAPVELLNKPLGELPDAFWDEPIDTVVMVESIEHIEAEEFDAVFPKIRAALKRTHGLLVVVNWVPNHPIGVGYGASEREHCRLVDDAFFASLAEGGEVVFQQGSHLVVRF